MHSQQLQKKQLQDTPCHSHWEHQQNSQQQTRLTHFNLYYSLQQSNELIIMFSKNQQLAQLKKDQLTIFLSKTVLNYICFIVMERLREYRKMLKIMCVGESEGSNAGSFSFEVRFQQIQPHNLFKYTFTKHKQQILQLYQRLSLCIFDFDNPFAGPFGFGQKPLQTINSSLKLCTQRIDIITNSTFIAFFSIHLHYDDFVNCLKQDLPLQLIQHKQEVIKYGSKVYCTDKPWIKTEKATLSQKQEEREKQILEQNSTKHKTHKEVPEFDRMICLASLERQCDLQLNETQVLDFTFVRYYQNELLYVLQQSKKTTKIKNFFKTMFNQAGQMGFLSIHSRKGSKFVKSQSLELLAEPISMTFNQKTNMLFVCTTVGVYIYLSKVEKKLQEIQIFAYVQLPQTIDFAANIGKAELYLLSQGPKSELQVYSINREQLKKTQYRYQKATAICYEETNNRLFVGQVNSIHVYSVVDFLEIKRLHEIKVECCLYRRLIHNHGYLFGLSEQGFMTVIELKPVGKEQLISVTTAIDLPQGSTQVVGSQKNRRLIITYFRNCIVLIDTMEGPFLSVQLNLQENVQAVFSDREKGEVLAVSLYGHLTILRLNEKIK